MREITKKVRLLFDMVLNNSPRLLLDFFLKGAERSKFKMKKEDGTI